MIPNSRKLVVIDTETTGITNKDRIVEISVLTIDPQSKKIIDEFDSLVNPLRDISNAYIHGITADMVATAPTFEDISVYLANLIQGSVFVAHNINFDSRFLKNEFKRVGLSFNPGMGFCTLRQTNQKLEIACSSRGIKLENAHRALGDARATAELALMLLDDSDDLIPISFDAVSGSSNPRTFRREHFSLSFDLPTTRNRKRISFPTSNENEVAYLDILDHLFEDSNISEAEKKELVDVANELGITDSSRKFLNKQYINSIVIAARRDGIFSETEKNQIFGLVNALDVQDFELPDFAPEITAPSAAVGKVCFTGEASFNGSHLPREQLESIAALAGFTCVGTVTKKNCTLVVAANKHSMSGKAKKARDFEIPVISVEEFLEIEDVLKIFREVTKRPNWF